MRDVLLAGTAGFLSSCAAAFAVHRALWKAADEQARQLDELAGHPESVATPAPHRKLVRSGSSSFVTCISRRKVLLLTALSLRPHVNALLYDPSVEGLFRGLHFPPFQSMVERRH